jgi:glycosyltransferase involved in cell wall biosynthesis
LENQQIEHRGFRTKLSIEAAALSDRSSSTETSEKPLTITCNGPQLVSEQDARSLCIPLAQVFWKPHEDAICKNCEPNRSSPPTEAILSVFFYGDQPNLDSQINLRAWISQNSSDVEFYFLAPPASQQAVNDLNESLPKLTILTVDTENLGACFSQAVSRSNTDWLVFLDSGKPLCSKGLKHLVSAIKNLWPDTAFCVTQVTGSKRRGDHIINKWKSLRHVDPTEKSQLVVSRRAIVSLGGFCETYPNRPLYDLVLRAKRAGLSGKQLNVKLVDAIPSTSPTDCLQLGKHLASLDEGLKISHAHFGRVSSRWALRIGRAAANLAGLNRLSSTSYDRHVLSIAKALRAAPNWFGAAKLLSLHAISELKEILRVPKNALRFVPSQLREQWLRFAGRRVFQLGYHAAIPCRLPCRDTRVNRTISLSTPTIAITTPNLNQGFTLERTIQSVLSQGYPDLEYTIQDGGSNDDSLSVIQRYENSLKRWASERDQGQADAIVRGFEGTSGEIMAYLNSDDILLPGALEFVGRFFAEHPDVDVVYGDRVLIDDHDLEINRWYLPAHDDAAIVWADYIPQETMFWRRRAWETVGGIDRSFHFAMDWDLILRFRRAGMRFVHLPRLLGAFRISDNQKTKTLLATTGFREMNLLRKRELGYVPSEQEVSSRVCNYIRKQRRVSGWRVFAQQWMKTEDLAAIVAKSDSTKLNPQSMLV